MTNIIKFLRSKQGTMTLGFSSLVVLIVVFYIKVPLVTQAVLNSTIRHSTPLILGALAGVLCERSSG